MMYPIIKHSNPYYNQVKHVFGSALLGYWPLSEAVGASVAVDISGNTRHAAYAGTPVLGVPGIGDCKTACNINEAGEVNAFTAGLAAAFNPDLGFWSFWFRMNDAAYWADATTYYLGFVGVSATMYYVVRKLGANPGVLYFLSRRGGAVQSVNTNISSLRWCQFTLTWNTAGDELALLINGTKQSAVASSLGVWAGSLADGYVEFGRTATPLDFNYLPGKLAHEIIGNVVPTNAQASILRFKHGQIIYEGDSRTASKQWILDATDAAFPAGILTYGGYGVGDLAVSGSTIAIMTARGAAIDAIRKLGKNILVVWTGVNDGGDTAQTIYNGLKAYCQARKSSGWKVILCTEIDANPAGWTAKYQALNVLIAADHSFVDAVADLGGSVHLQDYNDATYFSDGVHLTAAGAAVVAGIVAPVIASLENSI